VVEAIILKKKEDDREREKARRKPLMGPVA